MEIKEMYPTVIIIIGIGLVLGIGLFILDTFQSSVFSETESASQTILTESTATLTPIVDGITSSEVKAYNQTWLDFDGVNDYANFTLIPEALGASLTSDYTISLWYNTSSTATQTIFNHGVGSSDRVGISLHTSGTEIKVGEYNGSWTAKSSTATFAINEWHNVIMTKKGIVVSLYVDGVVQVGTGTPATGNGINFTIGIDAIGANDFNGSINDLRIFNHSLNESEAIALYNNGINGEGIQFSYIIIPDPQNGISVFGSERLYNQTLWINQSIEKENIVFVSFVGDIVNDGDNVTQFNSTNFSISILDDRVPYGISLGNHDYVGNNCANKNSSVFHDYFPITRYDSKSWWGGNQSGDGNFMGINGSMENTYQLFSAGNDDFIVFHIGYCPINSTLDWMNTTIEANPTRKVIFITHAYLDENGLLSNDTNTYSCSANSVVNGNDGIDIWNNYAKYWENLFLIGNGHFIPNSCKYLEQTGVNGNKVNSMFLNYQSGTANQHGQLRILNFYPDKDEVEVKTFRTRLGDYITDEDCEFTFDYSLTDDDKMFIKLNENSGTTAHDSSGNSNDGTIIGATWNNDGILNTLTEAVDYTIDTTTGLFTIVNSEYFWSQLSASWDYNGDGDGIGYDSMDTVTTGIATFADWIAIIVVVIAAAIVLGIVISSFGGKRNRI